MAVTAVGVSLSPNPLTALPYRAGKVSVVVTPTITGATLAYVSIDWGDGGARSRGAGSSSSHLYTRAGRYDITITVADSLGYTKTVTRPLQVVREFVPPVEYVRPATPEETHIELDPRSSAFLVRRPSGDGAS